jgi:hypothetical protein
MHAHGGEWRVYRWCTDPWASVCTRKSRNFQPVFFIFNLVHSACSTSDEYSASCTDFHSSLLRSNCSYMLWSAWTHPPVSRKEQYGQVSASGCLLKADERNWPEPTPQPSAREYMDGWKRGLNARLALAAIGVEEVVQGAFETLVCVLVRRFFGAAGFFVLMHEH